MGDCIFCKIVKGEIPSEKIFENEKFLAFMNINPESRGHALLIPKMHLRWMQDAEDEVISEIYIQAKMIMKNMVAKIPVDYVQLDVVGKDVPHFHIHLKPRMMDEDIHHAVIT